MTARTPHFPDLPDDAADRVGPDCRATVSRLQLVMDGDLIAAALDADPHPGVCSACRDRVAAARLVLSVLATPEPVTLPAGMTDRIVDALCADHVAEKEQRFRRIRRRAYAGALGVPAALAASVALIGWLNPPAPQPKPPRHDMLPFVKPEPDVAPPPRAVAQLKPMRIGDELSKAGVALLEAPRVVAEPVAATPDVFAKLADALTKPMAAVPDEPAARTALAELPDVALTGLEPLRGTAQKAFARLMRDVGTVSVKPKS
ncbi:unnamed protein product [Gemmataceae bacterium]|nr:unnamed protein product [Gemmataceae bacterium]VTT99299.1 unnamed protein product [Gemmataceae bacterium]